MPTKRSDLPPAVEGDQMIGGERVVDSVDQSSENDGIKEQSVSGNVKSLELLYSSYWQGKQANLQGRSCLIVFNLTYASID